jgi:MFS family permease
VNQGRFLVVWAGQLLSVVGSALTGFVLAVWVYQLTGSATELSIVFVCATLPGLLIAPVAGVAADRWNRTAVIVVTDCVGAAATATVGVLLWLDRLEIWHVYVTTAVGAASAVFHSTAAYTLIPKLVPKRHLGRANGLMQIMYAATIAAPVFAGLLLAQLGPEGVIAVDLTTFAIGVTTFLAARLPADVTRPAPPDPDAVGPRSFAGRMLGDIRTGWVYVWRLPGLFALIVFSGLYDLFFSMAGVLVKPLVLGFASPTTLGMLEFIGGAGLFVGGLVMTAWGGPKRRVTGMLLFTAAGGVALAAHSLAPSVLLIAVVAPIFLATMPIVGGSTVTLLQTKVEPAMLGRATAALRTAWQASLPVGALGAGVLAERVFEPSMMDGGALAGVFGPVVGTGPGRGTALVFLLAGTMLVLLALAGAAVRSLRRLEVDVPDAIADGPPATTSSPDPAEPVRS